MDLTIQTVIDTIKNVDSNLENIQQLEEYFGNEVTKGIASKNINDLNQMLFQLEKLNIKNKKDKKTFEGIISYIMKLKTEKECSEAVLNYTSNALLDSEKHRKFFKQEYHKAVDIANDRKKENEELLEKKSAPGLSLTVSSKPNQIITAAKMNQLVKHVQNIQEELQLDNNYSKRLSVDNIAPDMKGKIDRIFVKNDGLGKQKLIAKKK